MALNIVAILLILGITFFHSIFGLFSGLLNVFCTIASVCVAFGFFEALNDWITREFGLHSSYSEPICLVLLFVLTLVVLRTAADNLIRGNVRVPAYVDWAGGAICGFVNAMLTVGVLVIGLFLLPFGDRVFMHQYLTRTEDKEAGRFHFKESGVWLAPDRFTVGLFNLLSGGSMKGGETFAHAYPDFVEWARWTGNTLQSESLVAPLRDKTGDGFTNGIRVETWWEQTAGLPARYRSNVTTRLNPDPIYEAQTYAPAAGNKLVGMRLALTQLSADRKGGGLHNFRPTMIRLVGDLPNGRTEQVYPRVLAGTDPNLRGAPRIVDPDTNISLTVGAGDTLVDAWFDVPADFTPRFVEYRRHARVAVAPDALSKTPPAKELVLRTPQEEQRLQQLGQMGFVGVLVDGGSGSGDNQELPFAMSASVLRSGEITLEGERIASGRIAKGRRELSNVTPDQPAVRRFKMPEGKRILQVRVRPRDAATLAGEVFNFVGSTVNQYSAVDNQGKKYPLAGYYVQVKRGGEDFIELYYSGGAEDSGFRGMLDLKEVKRSELANQDEAVLGLIFIVDPQVQIVRIENQLRQGIEVQPGWQMQQAEQPGGG